VKHHTARRSLPALLATGIGLLLLSAESIGGEPVIKGYADYEAYRSELESIAASKFATLRSLGHTLGGREVHLLEIGSGKLDEKPAILIVGSVHPPHLLGSELATRLARRLTQDAKTDESVRKMLDRFTFYVIPRPAPDACEAFFRRPYKECAGNERPVDDDRDGEVNEDGPDDLNGDGWITMIRVEDPSGPYMPHPDDARVLIKADAKKNERGRWSLYVEGRDNDQDEQQGEDPPGGVAFNRNFTFRYPYFKQGAGPHQVSEVETRAVADFAFSSANIAVVLTCTPEDNLMQPWKPDSEAESQPIKTTLLSADAPYFDYVAEQYRKVHGGKDPPSSPKGEGSFSEWAYFHYGRWSFACRGWWIPKVDSKKEKDAKAKDKTDKDTKPEKQTDTPEPSDENGGADEVNALRWFAREKIDGFVDWKPIAHPDFPDRKVEVGGFKPFLRLNPPESQLEPLAEKHWQCVRGLVELLPRLAIHRVKTEPLGGGVWRVEAEVVNQGYLPTASEMGRTSRQLQPLQIQIELPQGVSLATGEARVQLLPLAGNGGKAKHTWLVLAPQAKSASLWLRVWSPSVGTQVQEVKLAGQQPAEQKKDK